MIIRKDSFLYKFNLYSNPSLSLCGFFWQIVFSVFGYILMCWLAVVVSVLGSVTAAMMILQWFTLLMSLIFDHISFFYLFLYIEDNLILSLGYMLGIFFNLFLVVSSFKPSYKFLKKKLKRIKTEDDYEEYVEKQPNLLVEYLKAKKQKVCPIIEYV